MKSVLSVRLTCLVPTENMSSQMANETLSRALLAWRLGANIPRDSTSPAVTSNRARNRSTLTISDRAGQTRKYNTYD
jgi:hypothetical protein